MINPGKCLAGHRASSDVSLPSKSIHCHMRRLLSPLWCDYLSPTAKLSIDWVEYISWIQYILQAAGLPAPTAAVIVVAVCERQTSERHQYRWDHIVVKNRKSFLIWRRQPYLQETMSTLQSGEGEVNNRNSWEEELWPEWNLHWGIETVTNEGKLLSPDLTLRKRNRGSSPHSKQSKTQYNFW